MSVQATQMLTARELINRHVEWKLTLKYAIIAQEPLTREVMDQILYPDRCPIGRWLNSGCAGRLKTTPEFHAVVRNHTDFHKQMKTIADLIQNRAFTAAMRAIDPKSPFIESSQRLAMSITALDRLEHILAPA